MAEKVYRHIIKNKNKVRELPNNFFEKNGYEKYLDDIFGFTSVCHKKGDCRYWDSVFDDVKIELKKTKSNIFFLDIIRYSEMYLAEMGIMCDKIKYSEQAKHETVTCFIKTKVNQVHEIYIVDTKDIYKILRLDEQKAKFYLQDYENVKSYDQSLNMQRGIKMGHLKPISKIINFTDTYNQPSMFFKTISSDVKEKFTV